MGDDSAGRAVIGNLAMTLDPWRSGRNAGRHDLDKGCGSAVRHIRPRIATGSVPLAGLFGGHGGLDVRVM